MSKILAIVFLSSWLVACGSSSEAPPIVESPISKACETTDEENTNQDCGVLLLDVTDAEGDFVAYGVNLVAMTLTKQDGTLVNVLPSSSYLDFVQYTELSELVSAVTIPKGIYTKAKVTLDYTGSDIQVEKDGAAEVAVVVDELGQPITQVEVNITLDDRDKLRIAPGVPAMLEIDFNLEASHELDLETAPVEATLGEALTAEINPLLTKDFRLRGPLMRVNEDDSFYRIALRPFYSRMAQTVKLGGVRIYADDDTLFDINGDMLQGTAGLTELAGQVQGTATVAMGTFDRASRKFTAMQVFAGSSVPGGELDAVLGSIMAREGDSLTLKGVTLIRTDGTVTFRDIITVNIGAETKVKKQFLKNEELTIAAISVGQRVSVLGTFDDTASSEAKVLDATQGGVRLLITNVAGTLNQDLGGELELSLQNIDRRNPANFDFTGTGQSVDMDANPATYQVGLGALVPNPSANAPLRAKGFVSEFGTAPMDFNAVSIIDYTESGAKLVAGWADSGTSMPFSQFDSSAMVIDLVNLDLGERHHLKRGGIVTDMNDLMMGWMIVPKESGLGVFAIKEANNMTIHSSFENFVSDLQSRMDDGHLVKSLFANGGFKEDINQYQLRYLLVKIATSEE